MYIRKYENNLKYVYRAVITSNIKYKVWDGQHEMEHKFIEHKHSKAIP